MSKVDELPGRIGFVIDKHIRPMFVPSVQLKATLLVRFEDDPEGRMDVLVTDDDDDGIRGIVTRRLGPIDTRPLSERLEKLAEDLHDAMGGVQAERPPLHAVVAVAATKLRAAGPALQAARALLVDGRASLWRSSVSPVTGVIPEHHADAIAGVQAFDDAISLIDAAMA